MGDCRQLLGQRRVLALALFIDLVAQAPQDHRGVVRVAADHCPQVVLVPVVEEQVVVVVAFRHLPGVERLVHHQEAHPIAEIVELRLERIVARALR